MIVDLFFLCAWYTVAVIGVNWIVTLSNRTVNPVVFLLLNVPIGVFLYHVMTVFYRVGRP